MATHRLTIRMSGPKDRQGAIELADFGQVCEAIAKALKNVEEIVAGNHGDTAFEVHDLRSGSAVLVVDARRNNQERDYRRQIISTFRNAISDMNRGQISPDLVALDFDPFRDIGRILKNGGNTLKIGNVRLAADFADSLERVSVKGISSYGSIAGVLERVNLHDKNELSLYPAGSTKQVACKFPDALLDEVRNGLRRTVTVTGQMDYVAGEALPRRCRVDSIVVHPPANKLPTLYEVRDLGPWGTDGLSAIDFVRAVRDE